MIYKATLDKTAKAVTAIVFILFISLVILPQFKEETVGTQASSFLGILFIVILITTYYFSIKSYQITENELIIKRPFDKVIFNKSVIKNVVKIDNVNIFLSVRTFGSGGVFGYFGTFWNKKFGNMTWYATRTDNVIIIETISNKKILITPDDYVKFYDQITSTFSLDKTV